MADLQSFGYLTIECLVRVSVCSVCFALSINGFFYFCISFATFVEFHQPAAVVIYRDVVKYALSWFFVWSCHCVILSTPYGLFVKYCCKFLFCVACNLLYANSLLSTLGITELLGLVAPQTRLVPLLRCRSHGTTFFILTSKKTVKKKH